MLSELSIQNYKSLRDVTLSDIPSLSVLVGANASGKSNFADALDFLSLVFREGLAAAVRAKGGYENICFRRGRRSRAGLSFSLKTSPQEQPWRIQRRRPQSVLVTLSGSFAFKATREAILADYQVTEEEWTMEVKATDGEELGSIRVGRSEQQGVIVTTNPESFSKELPFSLGVLDTWLREASVPKDELLMSFMPLFSMLGFYGVLRTLQQCRVYQISPHVARQTGVPERNPELGRHGENLPAAVDYLKRNHEQAFQELIAHLEHTVPTIEKLETGYVETKTLGLYFKERGVGRRWFSQDVSDGTIQTVSIFLPLVDPRNRILVVDEPENSLHPWILRHFVESCKKHSATKQIFLTTQSLVAVNEVLPESLYVVTRHQGETRIVRGIETYPELGHIVSEQLMGLGEYWDSGAIGAVPEYGEQQRLLED